MRTLQNNFTNPEQSERLLGLGVPADSADCAIWDNGGIIEIDVLRDCLLSESQKLMDEVVERQDHPRYIKYVPCWSVGRLIEIYKIVCPMDLFLDGLYLQNDDLVEAMVDAFVIAKEDNILNFSELED